MPDPRAMQETIAFVERHGYLLLFSWVLAEQSAIPLPSIPLLLATGALIRQHRLELLPAVLCCVSAALIADSIWFELGRRRGRRVLRMLCRVSLEPDSCVRQTENAFVKYGLRCLLVSKFIPGLNAVAAPLAGNSTRAYRRFLLYDAAGATLWCLAYLSLGWLFSEQLETLLTLTSRMGSGLLFLAVALFALWIGWKYWQRRRFFKQLDIARITPEELRDRLRAGEDVFVIDLRHGESNSPSGIPQATRIAPNQLAERGREIPRDREVVLFCS